MDELFAIEAQARKEAPLKLHSVHIYHILHPAQIPIERS
jgi:hypothetical protein